MSFGVWSGVATVPSGPVVFFVSLGLFGALGADWLALDFNIAAITASEIPAFFSAMRSAASVLNCVGPLLIFRMITSSPIAALLRLMMSSFVSGTGFCRA